MVYPSIHSSALIPTAGVLVCLGSMTDGQTNALIQTGQPSDPERVINPIGSGSSQGATVRVWTIGLKDGPSVGIFGEVREREGDSE